MSEADRLIHSILMDAARRAKIGTYAVPGVRKSKHRNSKQTKGRKRGK